MLAALVHTNCHLALIAHNSPPGIPELKHVLTPKTTGFEVMSYLILSLSSVLFFSSKYKFAGKTHKFPYP